MLQLTLNTKFKEMSLPVKQTILKLKNQNKPISEIAKTLCVIKFTSWYTLKNSLEKVVQIKALAS